jgi:hypothetical protein
VLQFSVLKTVQGECVFEGALNCAVVDGADQMTSREVSRGSKMTRRRRQV